MHVIDEVSGGITVTLGTVLHRFMLWEETADKTITVLVAATLKATIWVAVVDLPGQGFQTVVARELRAIVNGDGLKGAIRIRLLDF